MTTLSTEKDKNTQIFLVIYAFRCKLRVQVKRSKICNLDEKFVNQCWVIDIRLEFTLQGLVLDFPSLLYLGGWTMCVGARVPQEISPAG